MSAPAPAPETTRELLTRITDIARQAADRPDALLAEFFSDVKGVLQDLSEVLDEVVLFEQTAGVR